MWGVKENQTLQQMWNSVLCACSWTHRCCIQGDRARAPGRWSRDVLSCHQEGWRTAEDPAVDDLVECGSENTLACQTHISAPGHEKSTGQKRHVVCLQNLFPFVHYSGWQAASSDRRGAREQNWSFWNGSPGITMTFKTDGWVKTHKKETFEICFASFCSCIKLFLRYLIKRQQPRSQARQSPRIFN